MGDLSRRGLILLAISIGLHAAPLVYRYAFSSFGTWQFPLAFASELLFGYLLFRGANWVRWVRVAEAVLTLGYAVIGSMSHARPSTVTSTSRWLWIAASIVATALLFSKPLRAYFDRPANERHVHGPIVGLVATPVALWFGYTHSLGFAFAGAFGYAYSYYFGYASMVVVAAAVLFGFWCMGGRRLRIALGLSLVLSLGLGLFVLLKFAAAFGAWGAQG